MISALRSDWPNSVAFPTLCRVVGRWLSDTVSACRTFTAFVSPAMAAAAHPPTISFLS